MEPDRRDIPGRLEEIKEIAEEYLATFDEPSGIEEIELVIAKLHRMTSPSGVNTDNPWYNGDTDEEQ